MAILEVHDIHTYYGDAYVLQGLSLALEQGQILGLLGRNGVGKTTLLLTAMGFVRLARGSVWFGGKDISRLAPHKRAHLGLGWVPQEREIFPSLSVEENLTVAARPGRWDTDAVYGLFPRLKERRGNMGNQLSGGEQQMLTIARTLMGNPRALLLDEPSEGLAPIVVEQMAGAVRELKREGLAILLSEQNLRFARAVADRALIIEKGQIRYSGRMDDLAADREVRTAYLTV
jgi:branched-chain amino acid transport system ATP-binding protein